MALYDASNIKSKLEPSYPSRHDHDFVEVATRIWHFNNREIENFKGPYAD